VTTPGEGVFTYNASQVVDLVATADANYHFVNWTGDVGTVGNVTSSTTNITMNGNYTIVANFAINRYNLTTSSTSGGNVTTPGEGVFTYDYGTVVNLVATPDAYWNFVNWTGNVADPNSASTNVTVDGNKTVTANFAIGQTYTLTMAKTGNGTTTPAIGGHSYVNGTVVNITATPDAYWNFVNWTGNVADPNSASTNVTVDGNKTVTANFAINRYNLTTSSTSGGNVTMPGEGVFTYNASQVVSLVATADANYHFVNWTGDVGTVGNVNSATTNITMNGNYSIVANFAEGIGATLEGHVSFNGRGAAPCSTWIESFVVRFFQGGSEMAWSPINATTNNTGVFNITGITPGTYNVSIKNWTCLSEVNTSVALTAGNTTVVDFGTTREGDSNNDDIITGADRSLLYSGWGKSEGEAGYNIHYDFNRDGSLTGADRSLMYACWGQAGDLH